MGFADASALERSGQDRFSGAIAPGWDIVGAANGGYLLAIAARAATMRSGRPDPVSVTGHFLAPGRPGPVSVETEVLKEGRQFSSVSARIFDANGRMLVASLGSYGDLTSFGSPERIDSEPPRLPPAHTLARMEPTDTFPPPFSANVDLRIHPDDVPYEAPNRQDLLQIRGWFKWPADEPIDSLGLVVATDAFPPAIFNAGLPIAWTPTLELTVHLRRRPEPDDWLRCLFTTRFVTGGFLEEDGEVWNRSGELIAQSRQIALVPKQQSEASPQ